MELTTIATLSPSGKDLEGPRDEARRELWRRRYDAAVERLQGAGIKTDSSGAREYVSLRAKWDRYVALLAPQYEYELDEIDPALAKLKQ